LVTVDLVYSDSFICTDTSIDTTNKAAAVHASLMADPIPGVRVVAPSPLVTREMIERVHSPEYTRAILTGEPRRLADDNGVCSWSPSFAESRLSATAGVVEAAVVAFESGGISGSMSSGLHHARRGQGRGYCTLNELVIAAEEVLERGAKCVLIIDLDAHGGGGTASLIEGRVGIEQIDVAVNAFDGYLSTDKSRYWMTGGANYLAVVREALESVEDLDSIDLILYKAGVDPHEDCLSGGALGISSEMLRLRDVMVFAWARSHGVPVCFVFAGGYIGGRLTKSTLIALHRQTIRAARNC